MKKYVSILLAIIIAASASFISASALEYGSEWEGYESTSAASFSDVPADHWAKDNIDRVVAKNWFNGYPDGTFKPNNKIDRGEAMKVFVQFLGLQPKNVEVSSYSDVAVTDWYSPYIEAGKKLFPPLTRFNGETPFQPTTPITREDTVYALVTALRYTDDTINADQSVLNMFSDQNSISELIKPYMAVAVNKGLVSGYDDGTIGAQDPLTRAEFATLLYRASFIGFGDSELDFDEEESTVESVTVTPSGTYQMTVGESFNISAIAKMSDGTMTDYSANLNPTTAQSNIRISGRTVDAVSAGTATIQFLNDSMLSGVTITVVVSQPTDMPVFEELDYPASTSEETAEISGRVSDPNGAELSLNIDGNNIGLSNGYFDRTVQIEEGTNTFVLTLSNEYGVSTTRTVRITGTSEEEEEDDDEQSENAAVVAYEWSVDSIELNIGETAAISLFEVYSDGTRENVTDEFDLKSSNTSVATVDDDGDVSAVSAGTTNISFSSAGVGATISMPRPLKVTVKGSSANTQPESEATVVAYEWSVDSIELQVGESAEIKLMEVYSDGSEQDCTSRFNLSSSNNDVATVSGGEIVAVSAGTTNISFSSGGVGATISMPRPLKVTVMGASHSLSDLVALEWSADEITVRAGETTDLVLYGVYSDGTREDMSDECGLYSDNEDIAVVNGNTVRGIQAGTTEAWFSSIPKADLRMPGTIMIYVTD